MVCRWILCRWILYHASCRYPIAAVAAKLGEYLRLDLRVGHVEGEDGFAELAHLRLRLGLRATCRHRRVSFEPRLQFGARPCRASQTAAKPLRRWCSCRLRSPARSSDRRAIAFLAQLHALDFTPTQPPLLSPAHPRGARVRRCARFGSWHRTPRRSRLLTTGKMRRTSDSTLHARDGWRT